MTYEEPMFGSTEQAKNLAHIVLQSCLDDPETALYKLILEKLLTSPTYHAKIHKETYRIEME